MIEVGKMTQEQANKYVHFVARKGKALSLPPEQLEKFQKEYDKISSFLRENFLSYIVYMSAGGMNRYNKRTMKVAIEKACRNGLILNIKKALKAGDAEVFLQLCSGLRKNYTETVDDILAIDRAFMNFAKLYAEKNGVDAVEERMNNIPIEKYQPVYDALEQVFRDHGILSVPENTASNKEG